ncbi:hypothetical protein DM52_4833 [Burkholderia mallei]|nr:hypothetical protein DM52_4833 [Burkholderia mallei]
MPVQREADRAIVGEHVVGLGGRAERRPHRFVDRRGGNRLPQRIAAITGKRRERVRGGERLEIAAFEARAAREFVDARKRPRRTRRADAPRGFLAQPAHERQAEPHRRPAVGRRRAGLRFERRFPAALRRIDRQHRHAVALRVLHELRGRIEAHRLAVQERGEKDRRLVTLEPAARISELREARRMAFRKAILAEALDLLEDLLGEFAGIAALEHPRDDPLVILAEIALAFPRRHRPAQRIGLAGREARRDDRDLHHLLLENRNPERALEHAFERLARIGDLSVRLAGRDPPPLQVRMHGAALDRPRPDDRYLDHQIVIAARPQARQHRHLRARLDLEHPDRVRAADHVVGRFVILRNVLQPERPAVRQRRAAPRGDHVERAMQRGQHAEREHVDLHQPEGLQIVLVPLNHAPPFHRRVLDRHEPRELAAAHHEAARMLRQMAREIQQPRGDLGPGPDQRHLRIEPDRREAREQIAAAVEPAMLLRHPLDEHRIDAERLAGLAQRAARAIGRYGRRERRAIVAVLFVQILDDFLAPLVFEVDVDVGRLAALAAEEALEQQRALLRIDLRDAEAIADDRVRRRAAPLAQDVLAARVFDDIVDRQEIRLVFQVGDQREFELDSLPHRVRHAIGIAPARARPRFLRQIARRRMARGDDFVRIFVAQVVKREMARVEHPACLRERVGRKQLRDPLARAQVLFAIRRERMAAFGDRHPEPNRRHRVLQRLARADVHRHVAERDDVHPAPLARRPDLLAMRAVERALQLHEPEPRALAEQRVEPGELRVEHVGARRICRHENREAVGHAAQMRERPRRRGEHARREPVGAFGRVHSPPGDQLGQVPVALAVLREQHEAERAGARIVARRGVVRRHAEVRADDERQPHRLRRDVHARRAGERAFVGDRDAAIALLRRALDKLFRRRRAVQEREVRPAEQLRVVGQDSGCRIHAAHPNRPCRNQHCPAARLPRSW